MAIVTLKEALKGAEEGRYAVGMFNVLNIESMLAILMAAEECSSPVILSLPEVDLWYVDSEALIGIMYKKASACTVPVVLHYDHGHNMEFMKKLLDNGWTSLMIDESKRSFEENVELTSRVVDLACRYGASVEGELGHVPGLEGSSVHEDAEKEYPYTGVDEACRFVKETGIDALAVAIGTIHGEYRSEPRLNFDRLEELYRNLKVPMVLHGGSGLSGGDFRKCISLGIRKINVFTEMVLEPGIAVRERLESEPSWKMSYTDLMPMSVQAMKNVVVRNMEIFGSTGRA